MTALALLAAYLIGAVPVGFLVARAFGIGDIRREGSGNIGTSNVLRTAGRVPGLLTLVGDVAKGYGAVAVAVALSAHTPPAAAAAAVAAVLGNCWSVFLAFRGGKGVATGFGALLCLVPLAVLPAAVVWLVVALSFRYASLASLTSALCVPLCALVLSLVTGRYPMAYVMASLLTAAIIVYRHRDNIARLLAGTERRLGGRARAG